MTPIETLRILGIDYDVEHLAGIHLSDAPGECHNIKTKIYIRTDGQSKQHQKCVLLHEIIEALNYRLELELKHPQITALESGLFQVLRDNPDLLDYFKK